MTCEAEKKKKKKKKVKIDKLMLAVGIDETKMNWD
jgi:hypothetical protein